MVVKMTAYSFGDKMLWLIVGAFLASELSNEAQAATCPTGTIEDCKGRCVPEKRLGNGRCNKSLACLEYQMDYGDCTCLPGEVYNCNGRCIPDNRLGNGVCNPGLECEFTAWDKGDCLFTIDHPGDQKHAKYSVARWSDW